MNTTKRSARRWSTGAPILGPIVAATLALGACSTDAASVVESAADGDVAEPAPKTVVTEIVDPPPGYVGVLMPAASADVAPTYEGKIERIHVEVGQQVEQGQTVATFDPASAQEALRIAEADLRAARGGAAEAAAIARSASRRLQTEQRLHARGFTAADTVADARAQRQQAGAATSSAAGQVAAAAARVDQLKRQLHETELVAPFDGRVAVVYREAGALADPARPVVRLIDTRETFVRFAVPPAEANQLWIGSAVEVSVQWLPLPIRAHVRQVAPEIDAPTGLIFVEAQVTSDALHHAQVKPQSAAWVRPAS